MAADSVVSHEWSATTEAAECLLQGAAITGEHRGIAARDIRLQTCDLRNAALIDGRFTRIETAECAMLGIDVSGAVCRDVVADRCQLRLARAFGTSFERCWFEGCDLREADFEEVVLDRVVFRDCDLRGARFGGVSLGAVDVRGSRVEELVVDPSRMRGLVIDAVQAPYLASVLGLRVLG